VNIIKFPKQPIKITGQTAAEIICLRADSTKENMGLTNWRGDKIKKHLNVSF